MLKSYIKRILEGLDHTDMQVLWDVLTQKYGSIDERDNKHEITFKNVQDYAIYGSVYKEFDDTMSVRSIAVRTMLFKDLKMLEFEEPMKIIYLFEANSISEAEKILEKTIELAERDILFQYWLDDFIQKRNLFEQGRNDFHVSNEDFRFHFTYSLDNQTYRTYITYLPSGRLSWRQAVIEFDDVMSLEGMQNSFLQDFNFYLNEVTRERY